MLDMKFIREDPELIKRAARDKRIDCDVDRLIAVDKRRREIQQRLEAFRAEVNENGQLVGLMRNQKSPWYQKAIDSGKTAEKR